MKRHQFKMLRAVMIPILGGCLLIALLAAWKAGLFQPRLQRLVRQLQTAKDAEDRYEAARDLGEMGDEARPAVPALVAALQDDGRHVTATMMIFPQEHYVRNAAYQALKKIGGPETVEALIALIATGAGSDESRRPIRDGVPVAEAEIPTEPGGDVNSANGHGKPDSYTCSMAARLLVELGPEARQGAERLLEAIDGCRQGEVVKLSLAALNAMELTPDSPAAEKAREVLPQFCKWGNDTGRTAARLLYRLSPEDDEVLEHYVQAWLSGRPPSAPGVIPINERTVPLLVDHLGGGARETTMEHLAAAESERVVPALREALERPEWLVRAGAATVLAQHRVDAAAAEPELTRLLDDENAAVRQAAAEALWQCAQQVESVLPVLVAALDSEDARTRQSVRTFLNARGDDDAWAASSLAECSTSGHPKRQRLVALEILSRIGRSAASVAPMLLELLRDPDPEIQKAAAKAVTALEGA
jgi:HEAT repeat protein